VTSLRRLVLVADDDPDILALVRFRLERDGYDVTRRLRAHGPTATIPIILLTARVQELDLDRGLEAGANDYVTKPFSLQALAERVQAVLAPEGR
jgi:DNA-binding response OmpR family regulator